MNEERRQIKQDAVCDAIDAEFCRPAKSRELVTTAVLHSSACYKQFNYRIETLGNDSGDGERPHCRCGESLDVGNVATL